MLNMQPNSGLLEFGCLGLSFLRRQESIKIIPTNSFQTTSIQGDLLLPQNAMLTSSKYNEGNKSGHMEE